MRGMHANSSPSFLVRFTASFTPPATITRSLKMLNNVFSTGYRIHLLPAIKTTRPRHWARVPDSFLQAAVWRRCPGWRLIP
jgi:hypothetical protein